MKAETDIRKILIRNSLITYAAVAIALGAMILNFLTTTSAVEERLTYLYMVSDSG